MKTKTRPSAAHKLLAALLLASAAVPAQAPAQARQAELPTIQIGQTLTGTLTPSDPAANRMGRFKAYTFEAAEGERYLITMRSADFDAFLSVARSVGGITDVLDTDDDGGGDTDAMLRFTAPATGRYVVVAQALHGDALGAFTLQLERRAAPRAVQPVTVRIGQQVAGRLAEASAELEDGTPYSLYTFSGRAGQRLSVTMRSEAFDAFLRLRKSDGSRTDEVAHDDDSGGGWDARIVHVLDSDGEYEIVATTISRNPIGDYSLLLDEVPIVVTAPRALRLGQALAGELRESDPIADGVYYNDFTYTARAGERLRISLGSQDFDTYLRFGRIVDGEFVEIDANDDGPDGTDSLLEVTVPAAGVYTIRAQPLYGLTTGRYSVRVDRTR
jgi:hypothetical protein